VCEFGICLESKEWDENGALIKQFQLQPRDWSYQLLIKKRAIWSQKE
jgi:hypothetical protein